MRDFFGKGTVGVVAAGPGSGELDNSSMLGRDQWFYAMTELAEMSVNGLARYPYALDYANFEPEVCDGPDVRRLLTAPLAI